jgi:hypothetical protein
MSRLKRGPLTEIERAAIYRLPFSERSLISMRNQIANSDEDRWAVCRAAIAEATPMTRLKRGVPEPETRVGNCCDCKERSLLVLP